MNIGELLGAGLLGGVGNAAKGAGDRLREEAKQKREMALLNEQQENAIALQGAASQDAIDLAKAKGEIKKEVDTNQGEVTIDVESAGSQNNQNEQDNAGEIASALASLNGALAIERDSLSIQAKGKLDTATAALQAQYDLGSQANAATLLAAQKKVDAIVAANVASQLAGTQAAAAAVKVTTDAEAAAEAASVDMSMQNDQQAFTGGENQKDRDASFEKQRRQYKAELLKIKAAKVGEIKNFFDEKTGLVQPHERMVDGSWEPRGGAQAPDASTSKGLTLQVVYNDKGEEVKGYMSGKDFVQVGGAKAVKAGTEKEALAYFTSQAKYILGGAQNSFMAAKLTDDDTKLMREWIPEAEAAFRANPTTSLSQIVKNIMFKPWVLDDADITDADLNAGDSQASAAGSGALTPMQYARQIATKRQPDFVKAQTAFNNIMGPSGDKDTTTLFKRMRKMGYDPDLLTKK